MHLEIVLLLLTIHRIDSYTSRLDFCIDLRNGILSFFTGRSEAHQNLLLYDLLTLIGSTHLFVQYIQASRATVLIHVLAILS